MIPETDHLRWYQDRYRELLEALEAALAILDDEEGSLFRENSPGKLSLQRMPG